VPAANYNPYFNPGCTSLLGLVVEFHLLREQESESERERESERKRESVTRRMEDDLFCWWLLRSPFSGAKSESEGGSKIIHLGGSETTENEWMIGICAVIMAHLRRAENKFHAEAILSKINNIMVAVQRACIVEDREFLILTLVELKSIENRCNPSRRLNPDEKHLYSFLENWQTLQQKNKVHLLSNNACVHLLRDVWHLSTPDTNHAPG
jgi:hypothetical protein